MRIQVLYRVFFLLMTGTISFAYGDTNPSSSDASSVNTNSSFENIFFIPRASGWGLGGDREVGQGDVMAPVTGNNDRLIFIDGQAKYATDTNWFGGLGGGIRQVFQNAHILGAYVFVDRSQYENSDTGSSAFWTLSPGIESLGNLWDFRVNGYIPISSQSVNNGTVFADQTTFVAAEHFVGHEQFSQMVTTFTDTGPGIDGEIGRVIPGIPRLRGYAGGYHFSMKDSSDINGVSGRVEYAFNHYVILTAGDTYDNQQHNSIEVGLRLTLGGIADDQTGKDIQRRLMDPIPRNLATLSQGTGVPVVTQQAIADNGQFFLERDNVYFFTTDGGMTFDPAQGTNNCTFEHPCSEPSFTQTTVNDINGFTSNANLFFSPGTYSDFGGQLTLDAGQSMFGRTAGYVAPAQGDGRPLFLGGMSLLGNNQLDSIRLLDSVTDGTGAGSQVIALNIQNAPNVTLSNDDIQAVATETADLNGDNFASGIYANNSQVLIQNSSVGATASVLGANNGNNFAAGIGGNTDGGNADSTNNVFTLTESSVSGTAAVVGENDGNNAATGIGGNTASSGSSADFTNNTFTSTDSAVSGMASVGGNNAGLNFAAGIGGNNTSPGSSAVFNDNTFTLANNIVSGSASVVGDNGSPNFTTGIGGNNAGGGGTTAFTNNTVMLTNSTVSGEASVQGNNGSISFATGIGGNTDNDLGISNFTNNNFTLNGSSVSGTVSVAGDSATSVAAGIGGNANDGDADFTGNIFMISNSKVSGATTVGGDNNNEDFVTGIGGNAFDTFNDGNDTFTNNTFTLTNSSVSGTASVGGTNNNFIFVTGIGGNAFMNAKTDFIGNTFTLTNTKVSGKASVGGDNNNFIFATGIGGNSSQGDADFTNNTFTLVSSTVSGSASILGSNNDSDIFATGIGGNSFFGTADFTSNSFTLTSTSVNVTASVGAVNDTGSLNFASGIGGNTSGGTADFSNNAMTINNSTIGATALVSGINNATNQAIGINMNAAGNAVDINQSTINVLGQVVGNNTGVNAATGLNAGAGSTININNSTVNVTALANGTNTALATSGAGTINAVNTQFNITP